LSIEELAAVLSYELEHLKNRYGSITPHRVIRRAGMIKDYILTLKMLGFKSEDISIKDLGNTLNVEAYRDGKTAFTREYRLPKGYEVESTKYNFEGDFLIIRLKLNRRVEET